MSRPVSTLAMFGAALVLLSALVGCTGPGPEGSPPPPVASTPQRADAPVLMGGPRDPRAAPEPTPPAEQHFTAMAPVANPEDMSPDERARVYGQRYDRPHHRRHGRMQASPRATEDTRAPLAVRHLRRRRHRGTAHASRYLVPPTATAPTRPVMAAPTPAPTPNPTPAPTPTPTPPAATPPPAAQAGSSNLDWLSIPGAPTISFPGLGRLPSKYVTGAILLVLAIALLAYAARRGQTAPPPSRAARETVGAGPAFDAEHPANPPARPEIRAEEPVAPFPHNEGEHPGA